MNSLSEAKDALTLLYGGFMYIKSTLLKCKGYSNL